MGLEAAWQDSLPFTLVQTNFQPHNLRNQESGIRQLLELSELKILRRLRCHIHLCLVCARALEFLPPSTITGNTPPFNNSACAPEYPGLPQ